MQVMSMLGSGGTELVMMLMFLGGAGLPLGTPPEKENPVMSHVAPDQCLLYSTWAGMAQPDPASSNQTEQLLAEPEVQQFATALERTFASAMRSMVSDPEAAGQANPQAAELAKMAPLWARTLITRPAAIFVTRLEPQGESLLFEGGLIMQAGEASDELDRSLTMLLTTADQKPAEVTIGNRTFHKLTKSDRLPADLTWGVAGSYLLVGVGEGVVQGMNDRIRAQKEPAWLTELRQSLPLPRRSTVGYTNVKQLVETFAPLGGPNVAAVVDSLGLRQIGTMQTVTGLDETGIVSKSLLTIDGPPRGLLALLDGEGVAEKDLAHIPTDALFASSFSLQVGKLWDTLLETVRETQPEMAQQMDRQLDEMEQELGINIQGLLAALGNNWSLHAAKGDGGYVNSVLVVEVFDRARLFEAQQKLLRSLRAGSDENPVQETIHAGQTIYHYASPDQPLPVVPAWCLTDKQLIFGLYPQAVKAVLSRTAGEKSIATSAELQPLLAGQPAPLSVSYYDTRELFEATYWYAQVLAPMALTEMRRGGAPFQFDAGLLPSPRSIGKHLRPSVSVVRRTKRGLETETRQTLPVTNIGAAAPVAVALLLPAVQAAREAARKMQSGNNLKQQGIALLNYHDTFIRLPGVYNTDKDGKPLLSWRVAILPFMEQRELYNAFHLDEPWDSEHNKKLIARMPDTFKAPGSNAAPGKTVYLGVGGAHGVLGKPAKVVANNSFANGVSMAAVTDGTSNTIAIVEASDELAVEWTKPEEWEPDPKNPLQGVVGLRPTGFLALFLDSHVQLLPRTTSIKNVNSLFGRDDGNRIEP